MAVDFVIVVCTKCGKPHEREYDGYVSSFKCIGCGRLAWVGGKERGLKALPLKEIAIVMGVLFPIVGAVVLYKVLTTVIDPLDVHREAIQSLAENLITKNAVPDWQQPHLVARYIGFENENKEAWTLMEFEYGDTGHRQTFQVPIRFDYVKLTGELPRWEIKAIGRRFEGEPLPFLDDDVKVDWNRYQWRGFTERVQKRAVDEMILGKKK
jgi:hypothetical protein